MTTTHPGQSPAFRLAFACFLENITQDGFTKMPMQDQLSFAEGNAGLNPDELIAAFRYLAAFNQARAAALEVYRASHGHA